MGNYLITVGGTGQHFALAVTRLVRIGALPQDLKLIALDADKEGPLSKLLAEPTPSLAHAAHLTRLIDAAFKGVETRFGNRHGGVQPRKTAFGPLHPHA